MQTIQTLIGKQGERIFQSHFPELKYVGDTANRIPDFEHGLFFAECKVAFCERTFAIHLKQYQIESFKLLEAEKPVLYIIGFHNYENSMQKLVNLKRSTIEKKLSENMQILKAYIVDNSVITKIWEKRNWTCQKGHIKDCTVREGHLNQIINNDSIERSGKIHSAREFYGLNPNKYSYVAPRTNERANLEIGFILPNNLDGVIDYFLK